LKGTRIEVIRVRCRRVSRSGSDAQDCRDNTDINVLLSALGDIVCPAEELRHETKDGGAIIRPPFPPLRPRLSRMREWFSHRFKTKKE